MYRHPAVIAATLALLTLIIYLPLGWADFIHLDDPLYITSNPMVQAGWTVESLLWAWTEFYAGFWAPALWMSYMVDIELFGLNPGAFHLVNVLLHLINTVLIFHILHHTTGALWRSAAVAIFFAVHPLRVESVAWIVERKDVLSLFFGLLTIRLYIEYIQSRKMLCYILTILCFALALMSKSMLVTLPCALLLLDYWPLDRWRKESVRRLVLEKLPLFALTVLFSVLTFLAHRQFGGVASTEGIPILNRIGHALVAYVWYLAKHVWPLDLALFYPTPEWATGLPVIAGAGLFLAAVTAAVLKYAKTYPYLLTGWLWYLGTLVPVIGLVQVGMQAWGDRFVYLPGIGVAVLIVWLVVDLAERWDIKPPVLVGVAAVLLALFMIRSIDQVGVWQNTETVARHAIRVTIDNHIAETILGNTLEEQGRDEEAIAQYQHATEVYPDYFVPYSRLGILMDKAGKDEEAIRYYARALTLNPGLPGIQLSLGQALQRKGRLDQAIQLYLDVLDRYPLDANAHYFTGTVYEAKGETAQALAFYTQAARINPRYEEERVRLEKAMEGENR